MCKLTKKLTTLEDLENCKRERNVYFTFRPSNAHIMTLLKNNSELETLTCAHNFEKTFSKMSMDLLKMHGVEVKFENMRAGGEYRY